MGQGSLFLKRLPFLLYRGGGRSKDTLSRHQYRDAFSSTFLIGHAKIIRPAD